MKFGDIVYHAYIPGVRAIVLEDPCHQLAKEQEKLIRELSEAQNEHS